MSQVRRFAGSCLLILTVLLAAKASTAADTTVPAAPNDVVYLDETVISGNQELPRVLYILPWQQVDGGAVPQQSLPGTGSDLFEPLLPHEFRREQQYRLLFKQANNQSVPNPSIPNQAER